MTETDADLPPHLRSRRPPPLPELHEGPELEVPRPPPARKTVPDDEPPPSRPEPFLRR